MSSTAKNRYQNTTVRVPRRLYEQAKTALSRSRESSLNEFVVQAIEEKLRRLTEAEIDAAFAQMAQDPDYQRDAMTLAREFEKSDWEAFSAQHDSFRQVAPAVDLEVKKSLLGSKEVRPHARPSKTRSR